MQKTIRIGTRDSRLAVWQAEEVQRLLAEQGVAAELVFIKNEGDLDTITPLYAIGVQGVFTRTLDAALLSGKIDIAVHSMKDVPVQLAGGIIEAAVLKRASHKDIFVYHPQKAMPAWLSEPGSNAEIHIATSSIRRIAQIKHQYPNASISNIRGNVITRLKKVEESDWDGAIFAAAGLERIGVRPSHSVDLDWMLPAPAQGAIMVVCREEDKFSFSVCRAFHHEETASCVTAERAFLTTLLGGCSTPISAFAYKEGGVMQFKGNVTSPDGRKSFDITNTYEIGNKDAGIAAANQLLENEEVRELIRGIRNVEA